MKIYQFNILLLCVLLVTIHPVSANVLLESNWDDYAEGEAPGTPWSVWTGVLPGSVGEITVVEQGSPFGGNRSVLLVGTETGVSGPALARKFDVPTTNSIIVKFDFHIPSTPGAGVLPTMFLNDSAKRNGLKFNMANAFLVPGHAPKIAIEGKTFEEGEIIAPFSPNTWYHVEITTHEDKEGRKSFDVSVTPFGKDPFDLSGLDFVSEMDDFSEISFGWNSNGATGAIYISNLVVEEVSAP